MLKTKKLFFVVADDFRSYLPKTATFENKQEANEWALAMRLEGYIVDIQEIEQTRNF